jgi:hypothetical protein
MGKHQRTAIYGHPIVKCDNASKYEYETDLGVKRLVKKLKGQWKLFSNQKSNGLKYETTSRERIIFVGHTWQLWKNFKSMKCVCRDSPNLKSVILLSCSSGEEYMGSKTEYPKACERLSLELLNDCNKRDIEVIGFKGEAKASHIEEENLFSVSFINDKSLFDIKDREKIVIYKNGILE